MGLGLPKFCCQSVGAVALEYISVEVGYQGLGRLVAARFMKLSVLLALGCGQLFELSPG